MNRTTLAAVLAAAFSVGACGDSSGGGGDADTAAADTAAAADTTAGQDTAIVADTSVADTAVDDTATPDTAVDDTAIDDTATPDTGVDDTSADDTALADTAVADTATEDTSQEDTAVADTAETDCVGSCDGKVCGDDGCGVSCGGCGDGQGCSEGACVAPPADCSEVHGLTGCCFDGDVFWFEGGELMGGPGSCADTPCGWDAEGGYYACNRTGADPSGANPIDCFGDSPGGDTCPACDCTDKECGSNGCGGSCGSCGDDQVCSDDGQCAASGTVCRRKDGCEAEDPCDCVACVEDAQCTFDDDCVCSDCGADDYCSTNCVLNGSCDTFNEGCACGDCALTPSCKAQNPLWCAAGSFPETSPSVVSGDTTGATNDFDFGDGDCPGYSEASGAAGSDEVWIFTAPQAGMYTFTLAGGWAAVMYIGTDCNDIAGTCLAASYQPIFADAKIIQLAMTPDQRVLVVVDGFSNAIDITHAYTVTVTMSP